MKTLVKNIGQLVTAQGNEAKYGKAQGEVLSLHKVAIACEDGRIAFIGEEKYAPACDSEIDAAGSLVTAGLVDAHTHLVFGGWRQHEMAQKLAGVSYLDILQAGGGILSTVKSTRAASAEALYTKSLNVLHAMRAHGSTSVEIKSGYGLDWPTELKQLLVIRRLADEGHMDVVPTFMGAHAIPDEYKNDRRAYIRLLCETMLPQVACEKLARYCDIFCESAVFTLAESEEILSKAASLGLELKIHADEIDPIGGAELAGKMHAKSAEHLIEASDAGISAMAQAKTIAVLLPATSFYLDKPFARARAMLNADMAVAVASDFNPGSSPNFNLQFAMTLACLKYKLTPAEALTAVTLNGAAAIGLGARVGSLEVGKDANILLWDAPDLETIFYRYGSNQVKEVIYRGAVVARPF